MTSSTDLAWWQKTIAYEVYPKSFYDTAAQGTGTIEGITAKLDYLQALGVGAVWITPCYKSPMVDNGYDVADYYAIDPSFGTMGQMDELIAKGRERGIRMVMDLVFNHTSEQCAWFVESRKSRSKEYADWYIWRDAKEDGSAPTNWRSVFGGSAWEWCEERGQYYLHTFATQQPDLNWENPEVRKALFDIANFWANKGVGGFRIDAITYIKKPASIPCMQPRPTSPGYWSTSMSSRRRYATAATSSWWARQTALTPPSWTSGLAATACSTFSSSLATCTFPWGRPRYGVVP